jgi:predicted lactoylglutathione lyase
MPTKIFVNLAVKDLEKSKAFFKQLGFTFNQQFTDETAACMVIADDIYAMLLTHPKFKEFTKKDIADAHKTTEVLTCLSFDSKEKVNDVVDGAIAAGGTEAREPQDYGFMYGRSFNDLDGHI